MRPATLAVLAILAGCGYSVGPDALYAHRSISISVADNTTERRTHEFDLTGAVIRQLQASGITVNASDAGARLEMTIIDIRQPALVESQLDAVTVGSVGFRIRVRLVDAGSGKELRMEEHEEHAAFTSARGETVDTARRQVFDRLARWTATTLEKDW